MKILLLKKYYDTCKMKNIHMPILHEKQSDYISVVCTQAFQNFRITNSDSQIPVLCITIG